MRKEIIKNYNFKKLRGTANITNPETNINIIFNQSLDYIYIYIFFFLAAYSLLSPHNNVF